MKLTLANVKEIKRNSDNALREETKIKGTPLYQQYVGIQNKYSIEHEPIPGKPGKSIKRVVKNEEEASIVKYAFEQYDLGVSKKKIVAAINEKGYRYKDKPFTTHPLDNWLLNQKYTVEFSFGGRVCSNMYPQIVSKELFERVQKRLQKNKYFAGGTATAREPYLLTGKLYCGECGTDMVADGGTSKTGKRNYYYICKHMRDKIGDPPCKKRRENKDVLEQAVTQFVIDWLSDETHVKTVVDDVMNYYEKKTDVSNLKSIETKIANAKKEVEDLADAFVKAKSALLQSTIEKKMEDYETLLNDLSYQHAMLELERGYKITRQDMVDFVQELIKGDPADKDYQRKIIDNLVYIVFCSDDGTVAFLNIRGGKHSEEISFEDVKEIIKNYNKCCKGVPTQLPPSRQKTRTLCVFGGEGRIR